MWLGLGYLIPQKADTAGEPLVRPDFVISELNSLVLLAENGDKIIPEIED